MTNPKNQSGPMVDNFIPLACHENKSVIKFYFFHISWNFELKCSFHINFLVFKLKISKEFLRNLCLQNGRNYY